MSHPATSLLSAPALPHLSRVQLLLHLSLEVAHALLLLDDLLPVLIGDALDVTLCRGQAAEAAEASGQ